MKLKLFLALIGIQLISISSLAQSFTITPSGIKPNIITVTYPRISYAAILALPPPNKGDLAYDTTHDCLREYSGQSWGCINQKSSPNPAIKPFAVGGGSNDDGAYAVKLDSDNNIYITGGFSGTMSVGNLSLTSIGNQDFFIAKFDKNGNTIWAKSGGGLNNDFGLSLAIDANDNVYLTGYIDGNATIENTQLTSYGGRDILIAKYSSSGNMIWAKNLGSNAEDVGNGIIADSNGNIVVVGAYSNGCIFDTANTKNAEGGLDIFTAKYSSIGTLLWVQTSGSTANDSANGITIDDQNNTYTTGYFSGSVLFGSLIRTSIGNEDAFIWKLNPNGATNWASTGGGLGLDISNNIALDNSGNVYITGYHDYSGVISYGLVTLQTDYGLYDGFIIKFDANGVAIWGQNFGGAGRDLSFGIKIDDEQNVYLTGYFENNAIFGISNKKVILTVNGGSTGGYDIFVTKYTADGKLKWAQNIGSYVHDQAFSLDKSSNGTIYVAGLFGGEGLYHESDVLFKGGYDWFIAQIEK
jgi:hypothetical protein